MFVFAFVFALAARAVFVFASVFAFADMVESSAERTVRLAAERKAAKRQRETAQAAQTGTGALLAPEPVTRPSEKSKLAHDLPCVMHATGRAMGWLSQFGSHATRR